MTPTFWFGLALMLGALLWWWGARTRARRLEAKAMAVGPDGSLPAAIQEGFHRHDRTPAPALWPGQAPEVEQYVKVQINLTRPMACADRRGESTTWFAMGGQVRKVLAPDRVEVVLAASTDSYPRAFRGSWVGTLELKEGMQFPWLLTRLAPMEQQHASAPRD